MSESTKHTEMRARLADPLAALWQCSQSEFLARTDAVIEAASRAMLPVTDSLRAAILDALNVAESSLDYRPEFRRAMSNLHRVTNEILSSASPVAGWVSVEPALTIKGHVCEVGLLEGEGGKHGILIKRGDDDFVTIKGLEMEEVRALFPVYFDDVVVSFAPPAPVTPKQEQSNG